MAYFRCIGALYHAVHSALYAIPPSVCPSHWWISQKRLKLGFRNLHQAVPHTSSFCGIVSSRNSNGSPKRGVKQRKGRKNKPFLALNVDISKTV